MVIIFKRSALFLAMICIYQQSSAEVTPISKKTSVEARSDDSSTRSSTTGNPNNKAKTQVLSFTAAPIIVTAETLGDSSANRVKEFAGNRTVIDNDFIKKTVSNSIDGALQFIPGVKIDDETGTGVLPNISIRGLHASRSGQAQFLMDGIPLTLAPYGHTGQSIFPATLDNLERIDVVRGGAATQYGPNNVGGVINLITKPIAKDTQTEIGTNLTVFEQNGKPLTSLYARHSRWLNDDFGVQLEANGIKGDSFRDHSETEITNLQAKALWYIDDNQELEGFLQYYDADTEMSGALSPAAYEQDVGQSQRPFEAYQGKSTRWHAKYKNYLDFGDEAVLDLTTFGHHATRNFEWGFNSQANKQGVHWADPAIVADSLRTSPREFTVYGVEPKFSVKLGDSKNIKHHLISGMRYVNEDIDYKLTQTKFADGTTTTPRDWNLQTDAWAAYLSDEMSFLDERLKVTPGIRYENAKMTFNDAGNNTQTDNTITEWLPGLTTSYALNKSDDNLWLIYANAQKSLRTPQIADIRGIGEEGSELAWNYEVGTRYTTDNLQANLGLYRIDFKDQLQWNSRDQSFDNVGRTLHQGLETAITYSPKTFENLDVGLSYNYLNATLQEGKDKGNQLPYSSPHQLGWHASYKHQDYNATLSGVYYDKAYADNANKVVESKDGGIGETPAYQVWNLSLQKTLQDTKNEKLSVQFGINNLFDEQYYFRGIDTSPVGRYPAPSRSYKLGLNYQF